MKIVTAGMYRSGTTYQFNVVRVIMELSYGKDNVYSCWCDDYVKSDKQIEIVKVHKARKDVYRGADIIVSTKRNPEDIKGSMRRRADFLKDNPDPRFSGESLVYKFDDYMWHSRWWGAKASFIQDFERIKNDTRNLIKDYLNLFKVTNVTPEQVIEELDRIKPPKEGYDPVTLLHVGHITK